MHAVWHIPELRNLILTYLHASDIVRLGRTCRDLADCIIDHLWAEINTFDGFLRLLPLASRSEPLKVEDLERLDFYGRKVKRLFLAREDQNRKLEVPRSMRGPGRTPDGAKSKKSNDPWIKLWQEIAQLRPQTAFLPNLQHLRVDNAAADLLLPLMNISGARLESIYIKAIHVPGNTLHRMLESFQQTPRLHYIFVRNGLPDHIPDNLIENSPLVTFRVDPTASTEHAHREWPIPRSIWMKSCLENLTIRLSTKWHSSELEALNMKFWPALRQLRLNVRNCAGYKCHQNCPSCTLPWTGNPSRPQKMLNGRLNSVVHYDCERKPPSVFFSYLDHPHLDLLNLKFNEAVDGALFLDTMKAVVDNCHLDGLSQLVLSNGGYIPNTSWGSVRAEPQVHRSDVWEVLKMLGHLPRLRLMRIPIACDFLRELDMNEYRSIAEAFPALQTLTISHQSFASFSRQTYNIYDRTPLRHLAAFCQLFPALEEVEIGCVDATCLEYEPNPEWACVNVRKLQVGYWVKATETERVDPDLKWEWRLQGLQTYFPNADLTAKEVQS